MPRSLRLLPVLNGFSTGGSELMVGSLVEVDLLFVLAATVRDRGWFAANPTAREETSVSDVPVQQS